MNRTSDIDSSSSSFLFYLSHEPNVTFAALQGADENDLLNTIITTTTTTTVTNLVFRSSDTTKLSTLSHAVITTSSSLLDKYFLFKSSLNRKLRYAELSLLSLTLPLYAIVFILFIDLIVQRISSDTTVSGGGLHSHKQRRRQRMRSLIWTSNYLLVDFLGLLYELVYIIIHLSGDLALNSSAGRFYCQLQVYLPLYLTALMAYSLTAISVYRRRHSISLNNQSTLTTSRSLLFILALWIMPLITSIMPAYLLTRANILWITQHETTNECRITYTYGSTVVAVYMSYRLGNIFLLPLSISFGCYLTIVIDLIRMQRRFNRGLKRHVHIRKNLILQILFLFLNFAVFWLPAEIITLYTKNRILKDTVQVTKSLNILLDPLIIIGFDTRFSSAAQHFLPRWCLDEFFYLFSSHRQNMSSSASAQLTTTRTGTTVRRLQQSTIRRPIPKLFTEQQLPAATWNLANDDNITILPSTANHVSNIGEPQRARPVNVYKKQEQRRSPRQQARSTTTARSSSQTRQARPNQIRMKATANHIKRERV